MARPKKPKAVGAEKARLEIRFDQDVYERIKLVCDQASISVNQLLHGVARWMGPKLIVGEPERDAKGVVSTKMTPGCVFIGEHGHYYDHDEPRGPDDGEYYRGEVIVILDFTERRVVREKDEADAQPGKKVRQNGTQRKASGVQGRR